MERKNPATSGRVLKEAGSSNLVMGQEYLFPVDHQVSNNTRRQGSPLNGVSDRIAMPLPPATSKHQHGTGGKEIVSSLPQICPAIPEPNIRDKEVGQHHQNYVASPLAFGPDSSGQDQAQVLRQPVDVNSSAAALQPNPQWNHNNLLSEAVYVPSGYVPASSVPHQMGLTSQVSPNHNVHAWLDSQNRLLSSEGRFLPHGAVLRPEPELSVHPLPGYHLNGENHQTIHPVIPDARRPPIPPDFRLDSERNSHGTYRPTSQTTKCILKCHPQAIDL